MVYTIGFFGPSPHKSFGSWSITLARCWLHCPCLRFECWAWSGPPRTDNEYRARMMIWWKSIFTYVGTYCCLPSSLGILPWHSKFKAHPPTAHVCSVLCLVIYMIYVQCKTCQELSGLPSLFLLHLLGIDSLKASAQSYQDNIYPTLYFSTK